MKKLIMSVGVLVLVTSIVAGISVIVTSQKKEIVGKYASVAEVVVPKVVTIYVSISRIDEVTNHKQSAQIMGSGVFISPNGHILTCDHLFNLPYTIESVSVETNSGWVYPAILLREDKKRDLALIKVEEKNTNYAKIARPGDAVVGQEVVAVGAPLGLSGSVTTGVISATNRDNINYDMIQMSAPINPGNSGGPLFNLKGEIVGINVMTLSAMPLPLWSGIGFSVSASEINRFLVIYKGLEKAYE